MEDANKRTEPGGVHGNPEICGRVACCFREGLDGGTSPALCEYRFYHLMTIRAGMPRFTYNDSFFSTSLVMQDCFRQQ